jgi:DNA-binding winged helix-turn-helix (wHTH) protein
MAVEPTVFRFDGFRLDATDRRLWKGNQPLELNGRSFDTLLLLLREQGQLVPKERFFDQVWPGVVVSDSTLAQCIKVIRKELGDDAASPRYVQTVPRHGYRFVGQVEPQDLAVTNPTDHHAALIADTRSVGWAAGLAAGLGGAAAGLLGGLGYGLATATGEQHGTGSISTLAVFMGLGLFIGGAGGLGIGAGLSAGLHWGRERRTWGLAGAALGGLLIGLVARLLGSDAFDLLFGKAPPHITGPLEGLLIGAAWAFGYLFVGGRPSPDRPWRSVGGATFMGALAGALIPLLGGRLFAGSLLALAQTYSGSRLRMDQLGAAFGDPLLGHATQAALGTLELALFAAGAAAAVVLFGKVPARIQWSARKD